MISSTLLVDHPSLKEKFLLDKTKTSTLAKLAHTKKKKKKNTGPTTQKTSFTTHTSSQQKISLKGLKKVKSIEQGSSTTDQLVGCRLSVVDRLLQHAAVIADCCSRSAN